MRNISEQELKQILDKHGKWLRRFGRDWKIAESLDCRYWVSSCGKVATILYPVGTLRSQPLILRQRVSKNGYRTISFKGKSTLVHRIVAAEFVGDISGRIVHHVDGNRQNNLVSNLKITDLSENNRCGAKACAVARDESYWWQGT